ncbi:hypothetical protein [Devosia sp.]|uniref:hypothetical protein n=1 Tax=Devosia sp. TaxID=1871048 RepID=UPI0035AE20CE
MSRPTTTYTAEVRSALRGILALLTGDRSAARYFDFSRSGMAGSFIAVLAVAAVQLVAQVALGIGGPGDITRGAVQTVIIYGAFIGASAVLLSLIGRRDAFPPFVVTYNWTNAALTVLLPFLFLTGVLPTLVVTLVVTLLLLVNIGRLVMTLKGGQIAMLLATQMIGGIVALIIVSVLFPVGPGEMGLLQ